MQGLHQYRRGVVLLVIFTMAHAAWPQSSDPLKDARFYASTGRLGNAENALHSYLSENPSSAEAYFLLGYVLFRQHRATDSLAAFTEGAKYQHPGADDLKIVASDYVLLEDYADADKWFSEVVQQKPDDPDTWYLLGRTKYNENDFRPAVTSFERSLQLRPRHVETENNLGLCWKEMGDTAKAKAAFQSAIDWQGTTPTDAQPFLNLGTLLSENADESSIRQSLPYLAQAESLASDNPKMHEALADAYSSLKDMPKAQQELEKAVDLSPETSALHYKLGQLYRKQGMRDQAQQQFAICEKLSKAHSSNKTPNPLEADHPNSN